jgi:hypothetical protein
MDFMGLGMMVFRLNAAFSQKLTPRRKKIPEEFDGFHGVGDDGFPA